MGLVRGVMTGLTLTRDSLAVLRTHPRLVVFPLCSAVATLAFGALVYFTVFVGDFLDGGTAYLSLFAFYFVTTFVASFFTAALVSAVRDAFHGEEPTIRDGLAAAWSMKTELAVWAVISAVVGVILRSMERSDSLLSRLAAGVFALGWTVTTFFIVPVIVFEDVSVGGMFSKSAGVFRDTWGKSLSSTLGIGLVQFLAWVAGVAAAVALGAGLFMLVPWVGTSTAILGILGVTVGVYLVGKTAQGIAKTALYVYAVEGAVPDAFEDFDFETLDGRTGWTTTREEKPTPPVE